MPGRENWFPITYINPYDACEYTEKLTPHELIARLVTHIPDLWEQVTRYFGLYSNRTRGVRKKRNAAGCDQKGGGEEREARTPAHCKRKWSELLQLVFEVSLVCPRCGTQMKIVSFITKTEPIRKILAHLRAKGIDARAGPFADGAA